MPISLPRRDHAALIVIDMQERLLAAFGDDQRQAVVDRTLLAIDIALVLGLPVIVSEQYPKGLGPTIAPIRERLGEGFRPVEKLAFSCGRSPEFREALDATGRRDILVAGVETHVCVLQTVNDLIRTGCHAFGMSDAMTSRRDSDKSAGLALMDKAGAIVGTTEIFAFQLLERAGTDEFRKVSKLVR
jgi:nicotinamidase-related amidase